MRILVLISVVCIGWGCDNDDKPNIDKSSLEAKKKDTVQITVPQKTASDWIFDKIDRSRLIFKNGYTLETNLFDLGYIGQLPVNKKAPYLIFAGRKVGDPTPAIYIHSATDPKFVASSTSRSYPCPEAVLAHDADSALYELYTSKAFYGYVLEKTEGYVYYEAKNAPNGEMMSGTVFLSKLVNGVLKDTVYDCADDAQLNESIRLSEIGVCKEIMSKEELEGTCSH